MKYCVCRGINEKYVSQAFNEMGLSVEDLDNDETMLRFYGRCVEIALDNGETVSQKPLDKRCPPCKAGFKAFVTSVVAPQKVFA